MTPRTYHRTADVNGRKVFYREAGDPSSPTILLLHGLPTSSQMFREPSCVFICGSNGFVNTAVDGVLAAGSNAATIKTERYGD